MKYRYDKADLCIIPFGSSVLNFIDARLSTEEEEA